MSPLAPGLLVAAPPLSDPNFDRSVVLLAAHGTEGAFGWVVNGRRLMSLDELFEQSDLAVLGEPPRGEVRIGGPVGREQIWLVYRSEHRIPGEPDQIEVGEGITASPSRRLLEAIAEGRGPRHLVALAGHAGWAPEQLEGEIRSGAWLPTDTSASLVLDVPEGEIWHRAYARLGTSPMAFTSRTVGSA